MASTPLENRDTSPTKETFVRSQAMQSAPTDAIVTPLQSDEKKALETVAVFVCHGMGQQVPFETIDSVARVLRKAVTSENPGTDPPKIDINLVSFPESERPLPRAALQFEAADGTTRAVHIYETYWAPLTEGKVTLRDVMSFLFSAGVYGLVRTKRPFWRWMFGGWQDFGRPLSAPFLLVLVVVVVISLVVMNLRIVAVAAARAVTQARPAWPSNGLVADLTLTFSILLITAAVLAVIFLLARWRHRKHEEANEGWTIRDSWLRLWLMLSVIAVWATIVVVIGVGVLVILQLNWHIEQANSLSMWWATDHWLATFLRDLPPLSLRQYAARLPEFDQNTMPRIVVMGAWGPLVFVSYGARQLLVP